MKTILPAWSWSLLTGLGFATACAFDPAQQAQPADGGVAANQGIPAVGGTGTGASAGIPGVSGAGAAAGTAAGAGNAGMAGVVTAGTVGAMAGVAGAAAAAGSSGVATTAGATAGTDPDPAVDLTPTLIGDVAFSVPSQTFEGTLMVSLTSAIEGAEIRYTVDGLLPTTASTLYDGAALALAQTTQLRAQLFVGGVATGLPSTAIYIQRTFDATSDIPLIIMDAYAGGKPPTEAGPEKKIFRDLAFMVFEPVEGVAALSALPVWASRAGYHARGQSSASFEKAPYRVELWDNNSEDADYPMLGMPAESDWAMVGPFTDKTLVRNAFVYSLAADLGLEAPELRFAEVYINQDEGPLEAEDYQGVYAVTETIKNQKNRVNLKQLEPEDTMLPEISGGYIFKFDQAAVREDEGEIELFCTGDEPMSGGGFGMSGGDTGGTCWDDLELTDPKDPNPEQIAWIESHLQELHDALHADPIGDYLQYLDLPSFVNLFIINEITRDVDAYIRSHYMHKDRDGLVKAGPVWDYNFALNNFSTNLEGWQWEEGRTGSNDWYDILAVQPEFMSAAAARWRELRQTLLSDEQIDARIDQVSAPLVNAGPRDLVKWPVGESGIFGGGFSVGGGGDDEEETLLATWEEQIADLKQWTKARLLWLDSQFNVL